MDIKSKIVGALAALALSGSAAAAITVDVTHTGEVSYIDWNIDPALGYNGAPSDLIKVGDTATISYSIDLDQTPVSADPLFLFGAPVISQETILLTGSVANLSFSSGLNANTDPLEVYFQLVAGPDDLELYGSVQAPFPTNNIAFDISFGPSDLPFSPPFIDLYVDPQLFTSSAPPCTQASCFIHVNNVVSTVEIASSVPAPVPVPAPILMLGMAMMGLIGFGRRKSV